VCSSDLFETRPQAALPFAASSLRALPCSCVSFGSWRTGRGFSAGNGVGFHVGRNCICLIPLIVSPNFAQYGSTAGREYGLTLSRWLTWHNEDHPDGIEAFDFSNPPCSFKDGPFPVIDA